MITWLKKWLKNYLLELLDIKFILEMQQERINYMAQRVHAMRQPILEVESGSVHFPSLDELTYDYKLFEQKVFVSSSAITLNMKVCGKNLITDFRSHGQANHKIFMKIVDEKRQESVWLDCCETVRLVGIIPKDGTFCIRHDQTVRSSTQTRHCIIPSQDIHGNCRIYIRFGKIKNTDISCDSIEVS